VFVYSCEDSRCIAGSSGLDAEYLQEGPTCRCWEHRRYARGSDPWRCRVREIGSSGAPGREGYRPYWHWPGWGGSLLERAVHRATGAAFRGYFVLRKLQLVGQREGSGLGALWIWVPYTLNGGHGKVMEAQQNHQHCTQANQGFAELRPCPPACANYPNHAAALHHLPAVKIWYTGSAYRGHFQPGGNHFPGARAINPFPCSAASYSGLLPALPPIRARREPPW
jgi:hypothetical protein